MSQFTWNQQSYTYTCPQGNTLTTTGHWHKKRRKGRQNEITYIQQFKTPACKGCPAKKLCTSNSRGRVIERSEFAPYVEQNARNIENNKELYRRRQAIVEHPFGVMKRQWGFYYILSKKGMARASADVGLIFIAYNLRRLINILGKEAFGKYLNACFLKLSVFFRAIRATLSKNNVLTSSVDIHTKNIKYLLNTFIFGNKLRIAPGL
jgi:hypothetical protein